MKKWYKSKMIWFNVLVGVMLIIEQNLSVIQQAIPQNFSVMLIVLVPIINLILRVITTNGLTK